MKPSENLDPPVFLYVKTHNVTGLKYFGRTIKDPLKYKGSGLYWLRHLKAHGYDVTTEILGCYTDLSELKAAASKFTEEHDIVASSEWANLIAESGLAGIEGWSPNEAQREALGERTRLMWQDAEFKARVSRSQSLAWTEERKAKHSEAMKERAKEPGRAEALRARMLLHPGITAKAIAARTGVKESEETRARKSASMKGKPKTQAHREALSKARTDYHPPIDGAVFDESTRAYKIPGGMSVKKDYTRSNCWICSENGQRFYSLRAAIAALRSDDI